jgi:hypothetical protein
LLAVAFFSTIRLTTRSPLTGDEPHYLILTQSILTDRDLTVANNYARGDHWSYYFGELDPHIIGGDDPRTRRRSLHAPGVAALIAPAFAVGGSWGAIVFLAALVAVGTGFVWSAGYLLTGSAAAAWFGWALVTLTSPVALYGALIYPDPVAGASIAVAVWAVVRAATDGISGRPASEPGSWRSDTSFALGVLVGVLPWLHTRLAIPAALLTAVLAVRIWQCERPDTGRRALTAFLVPVILGFGCWFSYFRVVFGSFDPRSQFGGDTPISATFIVNGLTGLLADQEFGLVSNAPVYLVAFLGLWTLWRRNRRLAAEIVLVIGPYAVAASGYPMWWGGACPPARFLVPVVFPLGATAAVAWSESGRSGRVVALALLGVSVAIASVMAFARGGALAYNDADGSARWAEWLTGGNGLSRFLPSFFLGYPAGTSADVIQWTLLVSAIVWGVFLSAILIASACHRDR